MIMYYGTFCSIQITYCWARRLWQRSDDSRNVGIYKCRQGENLLRSSCLEDSANELDYDGSEGKRLRQYQADRTDSGLYPLVFCDVISLKLKVLPPQFNGYSNVEKSRMAHKSWVFSFLKIKGSPKLCKYEMKDYWRMKNSQKLRNVDEKCVII